MTTENAAAEKATRRKLSPKDEVRALLDRLPEGVTLEDIQYHLDVVVKVLEAEANTDGDITDEEFGKQLEEKWRAR